MKQIKCYLAIIITMSIALSSFSTIQTSALDSWASSDNVHIESESLIKKKEFDFIISSEQIQEENNTSNMTSVEDDTIIATYDTLLWLIH